MQTNNGAPSSPSHRTSRSHIFLPSTLSVVCTNITTNPAATYLLIQVPSHSRDRFTTPSWPHRRPPRSHPPFNPWPQSTQPHRTLPTPSPDSSSLPSQHPSLHPTGTQSDPDPPRWQIQRRPSLRHSTPIASSRRFETDQQITEKSPSGKDSHPSGSSPALEASSD